MSLQAVYHRFDSDRLVRHYGDELDLLASGKFGKTTVSVRYADYNADLFATDTRNSGSSSIGRFNAAVQNSHLN